MATIDVSKLLAVVNGEARQNEGGVDDTVPAVVEAVLPSLDLLEKLKSEVRRKYKESGDAGA
jgi:hypothetical protein